MAWGEDNRTCALRVVGHGPARRVECRVAGRRREPVPRARRDVAGGLHGIDAELELEPSSRATPTSPTARASRARCTRRASGSRRATSHATAFGEEVVEHYLNAARVELDAFDGAVTDWERFRGFERL